MNKPVLFIHGGGEGIYEADKKLATSLQDDLGDDYEVLYPKMPNRESPGYELWKMQIGKELADVDDEIILVGHSLGGSVLLKYLSEEVIDKTITGLFLIAPPYWGTEDWKVDDYILDDHFAAKLPEQLPLFFYHSRDDEWVPFDHLTHYAEKLPQAIIRQFDDRGHQFKDNLSEIAEDIKQL